jgi:hypothetical protein
LWCSHTGNHPQQDAAKFGYITSRTLKPDCDPSIVEWPATASTLNSNKLSSETLDFLCNFFLQKSKNSLCLRSQPNFVFTFEQIFEQNNLDCSKWCFYWGVIFCSLVNFLHHPDANFLFFSFFNSLTFWEKVTGNFCHIFTEFLVMGHTNQSLSKVLYFPIPKIHNTIIMFSLSSLGGKLVAKIKTSSNATFKMRVLKVVG